MDGIGGRFAGVDWATDAHAVCVVDDAGAVVAGFGVEHTADGLAVLCRRLGEAGAARVAIERPDGAVVEALIDAGLEVVVVSSRAVKSLRCRYGTAGNKCDRGDAYILADCLRTDGHRWPALEPDSAETVALRSHVRARKDLVSARVAAANQLRAHLRVVFPGAVGLFSRIDSAVSLRFLQRFPSEAAAGWLSPKRLATWLRSVRYSGRRSAEQLYERLLAAAPGARGDAQSGVTAAYIAVLWTLRNQINQLDNRIAELLDAHPDAHIFTSLPRAGTIRAATLLAEIGDSRARYPDPQSLAAAAGVAPSTRSSGRHRSVTFRWACDKRLRDAICDFAGDSRHANAWAQHRYQQLRAAGKRHPHAERILARSWTHIIWRIWQDHTPYDTTRHRAHQQPQPNPA